MSMLAMDRTETTSVEAILKDELARGNRALRGVAPVISHMLETSGPPLVSDAIVARLRGMLSDIARQLLEAGDGAPRTEPVDQHDVDAVAGLLADESSVTAHLYALAMEGYLTERLEQRTGIDPVLSPLLQELIASDQPATAELAMTVLAAQSRFMQCQRRMELPLGELPFELFLTVLERFESSDLAPQNALRAIEVLKRDYDEGAARNGLLGRLVGAMVRGTLASLELEHAGLALFASSLAALVRQPRDLAIFSCHEGQAARLALGLRAAGLDETAIERQFYALGGVDGLPAVIASMPVERAQALLADDSLAEFESEFVS